MIRIGRESQYLPYAGFFVTKIELCLTGSITSENKGGWGSDPLRKNSITNPLFCSMASLIKLN